MPEVSRGKMRILAIRPGALGDVLLTLPALQALAAAFPQASIELMGDLPLLQWLPERSVVHKVSSFDRADLAGLFQPEAIPAAALQAYLDSFDVIVSYATAPEHVFARNLARLARGRVLSFDARPADLPVHMSAHLQQPLAALGITPGGGHPVLQLTTSDRQEAERWWAQHGLTEAVVVAIHPGSGSPAKNWRAERFAALARHLQQERGARLLLVSGPADEQPVDAVRRHLSDWSLATPHWDERGAPPSLRSSAPERLEQDPILLQDLRLPLLAAVLSRCWLYVGNDSGVSHLAAAVGAPTVAIFGPTDPDAWAPRGPAVRTVCAAMPCAPCHGQARQACQERVCLESVAVPMVLEAIRLLGDHASAGEPAAG